MSTSNDVQALRYLPSVRERCSAVYKLAQEGKVDSFTLDETRYDAVVDLCAKAINKDYGENYASIQPHSRWRHFTTPNNPDLLGPILKQWKEDGLPGLEIAKRLIDLFVISVLVDGNQWSYTTRQGEVVRRSEGLAVASLEMFLDGLFSDDKETPHQVTASGLRALSVEKLSSAFQVSSSNPMSGLEGRCGLLLRLADALDGSPTFFGSQNQRPGNMLDYLKSENSTQVPLDKIWEIVIDGLGPVWPASRTQLEGVSLGDAWPCAALATSLGSELGSHASIVPFHKLSQWLTYSLLEPMQKILGWEITGTEVMTGLPEYRNGGLLVDLGLLTLTEKAKSESISQDARGIYKFSPSSQTVIEWRAITVIALDIIASRLRTRLSYDFTLPQVLESATWKCGRIIAADKRDNGGPPIEIESDGTIF